MPLGQYLTGAIFFAGTFAAALAAAALLTARRLGDEPALTRALAGTVLATAALVGVHVIPAALGLLSRTSVLTAALVLLAVVWRIPRCGTRSPLPAPAPAPSGHAAGAIALITVLIVAGYELGRLRVLVSTPITDIDMLAFHLPGVANFIQTGTLWQVTQFLPGFATAQYPNNGDFLLLGAVLPWHDLAFVRLVPLPFYVVSAVATYALALEIGAARASAATFAAAVVPVPALSFLALEGLPDSISLAMLLVGILFLLRHGRSHRFSELLLAGTALGLSLGTKWYGLTAAAAVVAAWLGGRLLVARLRAGLLRDGALLISTMALGGGIWVLRNLIESGNPIYPKAVGLLGAQLFPGSAGDIIDRYGYTIANYLGHPHILATYILPGFRDRIGFTGIVLVAGLLTAAGTVSRALGVRGRALRPRRRGARAPGLNEAIVLGLCAVVLGMVALYVITPGSAYGPRNLPVEGFVNIRWLMPAVLLGAALSARAASSSTGTGIILQLGALFGVIDSVALGGPAPVSTLAEVLLALALGAVGWRFTRGMRSRLPRRTALGAAFALGLLAALVGGRVLQTAFDGHAYGGYDPTFAWIDQHARSGHRIALAGIATTDGLSMVLPAFGPRLENRVTYLGQPVRHSLHVIDRQALFQRRLHTGHYDLVLIGLQDSGHAEQWSQAAGYRLLARSARLALYGI